MIEPDQVIFDKENFTLLLSVSPDSVNTPDYVTDYAGKAGLEPKEELHITVLGFGSGRRIEEALNGNMDKIENFIELVNDTSWYFDQKSEFYSISKSYKIKGIPEERHSIISMAEVADIDDFFISAERILGIKLEVPPAHITIFSSSSIPENSQSGIGVATQGELAKLNPKVICPIGYESYSYKSIALPTRPQPDTIVAVFILKRLGMEMFEGIEEAEYLFMPRLPGGETEESLLDQEVLLLDVGGGAFDHHNKSFQTTASSLIASYLEMGDNPALSKLLQYAERDDFYGKGTISTDPLDRAFGLSGLVGSLNKKYVDSPEMVIELILPILDAFYEEEVKRAFEMPQELEEKLKSGQAHTFNVRQGNKRLKCIFIETDNASMAGFLRSKGGGGFDVVALRLSSGHVNILTRPAQRVDLRSLAAVIRYNEAESRGMELDGRPEDLAVSGSIKEVSQWYYDTATNSLLNGGPNPVDIEPTSIDLEEFPKFIEAGLSEKLWSPSGN